MFVLWAILAAAAAANDDPELVLANTHETRQQVAFELIAPGEAVFTVTREFAARSPADPIGLERHFHLPDESVVTSFATDTGGAWRKGRLMPVRDDGDKPRIRGGNPSEPWASLEADKYRSFTISTASFRAAGKLQIRYTLWARGERVPDGRRWTYCGDSDESSRDQEPAAELSLPARHPELRVHPDPDDGRCFVVEKPEPDGKAPAARFGVYPFAPGIWWWRLEVTVPRRIAEVPSPTEAAPTVFVLDASRSQERRGGLAPQLAIVEAYLANAPGAEVELVLTSRTAAPVFGRFVAASAFAQALPADLPARPLANGSFLDRGAALAAELLRQTGKPGRIILFTDGTVRSRFDRRATIAALRRAPAGTLVHLLYPSASKSSPGSANHRAPEGLGALAAAFGGAAYAVDVTLAGGVVRPPEPKTLRPLFRPDAVDSLNLVDASRSSRPDWPDWSHQPADNSVDRIAVGETGIWSGVSTIPPPNRLELTGWIWSKKLRMSIHRDPPFERRLARLALSEDTLMDCQDGTRHRKDALTQGFAVPGLMFWVAGSGEREQQGYGGIDDPGCFGGSSGGGSRGSPRVPQDLVPEIAPLLDRCAVSADPAGTIGVEVETDGQEILDVTVEGGDQPVRGCLEEGLWADRLPPTFNEHYPSATYRLRFAARGLTR